VASKIKLVNQFGATELGICSLLHRKDYDPRDWRYVQFHPEDGHLFRPSVDDTYELCIVRNEQFKAQQPTFTVFPDLAEYRSRDLFVRHPTKPDMWRWKARADDIIVFLNGEKTNPVSMEQHIVARNPEVTAALVIGAQRFQAALLLEVNMGQELSIEQRAAAIERFWPSIEEANHECPTHAKIAKTHILFISPNKPLLRTGKGTIPRSGNLSQYASEIGELYKNADRVSPLLDSETEDTIDLNDTTAVLQYIRRIVAATTEWKTFDDEDNFFHLGMDSLQGLVIVRRLRQNLNLPTMALSTVYTSPSVNSLALAIMDLMYHRVVSKEKKIETLVAERQTALERFKSLIKPVRSTSPSTIDSEGHVIVLTGSTGALGAYILAKLLLDPSVSHVYCLNRSIESVHMQVKRNTSLHLSTDFPPSRVTFLTVNLAMPSFDLPSHTYNTLLESTTLIIHSAWPVNFNIPLSAFEPSIHGLVSLIDFAGSSDLQPHLHFISSISSVMSTSKSDGSLVPETVFSSPSIPLVNAYAESKHISELLLDYAQTKYNLSLSFSRVGQVAGAVDAPGLWNPVSTQHCYRVNYFSIFA
jgi:aryl carrier-like protein